MIQKLKRWLPFLVFSIGAVTATGYLFLFGDSETYFPQTDDPAIIYNEACASCHGQNGQGNGILYPAIDNVTMSRQEIKQIIQDGTLLMPAYEYIRADTLNKLSLFVYDKKFIELPAK